MMSLELKVLFFTVVLGFVQLFAASAAVTKQRGTKWNLGPRDGEPPALLGTAGRLQRAFENFRETFPFFLAAVCLIGISGRGGHLSQVGACTYLAARVVYVPLYIFGVVGVRTVVWIISTAGIIAMLAQVLFHA